MTLSPGIAGRLQTRDPAAFDELLRLAGPPLIAFLVSYVQSRDVAEDLLQNILLRVWELGPEFVPTSSVETYLFGMARNEALMALRKERIQERSLSRYAGEVASDDDLRLVPPPDVGAADDQHVQALARALQTLTEHQRAAFDLRYGQGMKISEIAQVLGISEKGVERLMTRIKQLIAEQVLGTSES